MGPNPKGAIGLNLIQQEVEQFRKIQWLGRAQIAVKNQKIEALARQYTIKSSGAVLCEI